MFYYIMHHWHITTNKVQQKCTMTWQHAPQKNINWEYFCPIKMPLNINYKTIVFKVSNLFQLLIVIKQFFFRCEELFHPPTTRSQPNLASLSQFFKIVTSLSKLCTPNQHHYKLVNMLTILKMCFASIWNLGIPKTNEQKKQYQDFFS